MREPCQGIFRLLERMTFFTQIAAIEVTGDDDWSFAVRNYAVILDEGAAAAG